MRTVVVGILLIFTSMWIFDSGQNQDDYKTLREKMVNNQIIKRGVTDKSVLKAMQTVKRHLFVPSELQDKAYEDSPLPIGNGQTISQPYIVAFMTEAINPKPNHKILEIGTGSGYQAAVLSKIVDSVYTIEIIEELGTSAMKKLKKLGYNNIKFKIGDGYNGWKKYAPFDAIIVTAAAEYIPPPLIKQLKPDGKMIIPIGSPFLVQTLVLVTKKDGKVITKNLFPVRFVPFTKDQ